MAFIDGGGILALLPGGSGEAVGTAVTLLEANRFVAAAIARLAESHSPELVPVNAVTEELVEELAYAKALKRHYIKGEAEIDTEPLDNDIERVEKRFAAYDTRHIGLAEREASLAASLNDTSRTPAFLSNITDAPLWP